MKRVLTITGTLMLCLLITIVPAFAIQGGFYDGQTLLSVLGAQYRLELSGNADDAIVLFDTRGMYWYENNSGDDFMSNDASMVEPDCYYWNTIVTDTETSIIYNQVEFVLDHTNFPGLDTSAQVFMQSDRFSFGSNPRLAVHLEPILSATDNAYLVDVGSTVSATIRFYALNTDGNIIETFKYRNDLIVGGTYDLTASFDEFFEGNDIQYYWIEYEGWNVIPTFVQDFSMQATIPWSDVRVVDWATDIVYPEVISYDNFNLLQWISTAVDGFMRSPLFVLGDFTVTIGAVLAVGITVPIFVAFLRRYAGG